jgi:hypothetical protein
MSERVLHERYVLRNRAEKMEKDIEEIKERMDALLVMSNKMDNLLAMIAPVHAHAAWVDTLRKRLSTIGLVKDRRISNGEGTDAV